MTDDSQFVRDHAAGLHQAEIVQIMKDMEPAFIGHSRAMILFALARTMAGMLGPASKKTRRLYLQELPRSIQNILNEMDRLMGKT